MSISSVSHLSTVAFSNSALSLNLAEGHRLSRDDASSATPTLSSTNGDADLGTEIAAHLEQDQDYQILRKSFSLESRIHASRTLSASSESQAAHFSRDDSFSTQRFSAMDSLAGVFATKGMEVSWERQFESRDRLDISIGADGWSIGTESFQQISVRLDVSSGAASMQAISVQVGDPLVLDLSGQGIMTTGIESGLRFDLDGDGTEDQTSFATGGSWFLALDRDANGRIDDGHELFGDQNGAAHGFAELAQYDDNADGLIDASDKIFSELMLTQVDKNGNQVVKTLAEADVTALELEYQNTRKALNLYDSVAQVGRFHRSDGSTGETADVLLGYSDSA